MRILPPFSPQNPDVALIGLNLSLAIMVALGIQDQLDSSLPQSIDHASGELRLSFGPLDLAINITHLSQSAMKSKLGY
jgi:hypothetical protein